MIWGLAVSLSLFTPPPIINHLEMWPRHCGGCLWMGWGSYLHRTQVGVSCWRETGEAQYQHLDMLLAVRSSPVSKERLGCTDKD